MSNSHVSNFEVVIVLDSYVIHVHGLESIEIHWKGDKVKGGAFMKLKQIRVIIITFPTQ